MWCCIYNLGSLLSVIACFAVQTAGLAATVNDPSFIGTVFAPTDDAFAAYQGPSDPASLQQVWLDDTEFTGLSLPAEALKRHIMPLAIMAMTMLS